MGICHKLEGMGKRSIHRTHMYVTAERSIRKRLSQWAIVHRLDGIFSALERMGERLRVKQLKASCELSLATMFVEILQSVVSRGQSRQLLLLTIVMPDISISVQRQSYRRVLGRVYIFLGRSLA